ncbi:MAG: hypothetical protein ACO292_10200 [Ilumatobacteraceae bacterium]
MSGMNLPPDGNDEFEPDDTIPPAPQPMHDRTWRHPAELGFQAHTLRVEQRPDIGRTGRGLLLFSFVAGSILLLGLLVIVQPNTSESNVADIIELTSKSVEVAAIDGDKGLDPMAMVVGDGTFLVTTATAVTGRDLSESITVDLRDGSSHEAVIVHVDERSHLAVLRIGDAEISTIGTLPEVVSVESGQGVIVLDEQGFSLVVGESTPDGLFLLSGGDSRQAPLSVAEGSPVLDQWGGVLGLYTSDRNGPCFIPIDEVKDLLDELTRENPSGT